MTVQVGGVPKIVQADGHVPDRAVADAEDFEIEIVSVTPGYQRGNGLCRF